MSSPCHVELILAQRPTTVAPPKGAIPRPPVTKLTRRYAAKLRNIKRSFKSRAEKTKKITAAIKKGQEKKKDAK